MALSGTQAPGSLLSSIGKHCRTSRPRRRGYAPSMIMAERELAVHRLETYFHENIGLHAFARNWQPLVTTLTHNMPSYNEYVSGLRRSVEISRLKDKINVVRKRTATFKVESGYYGRLRMEASIKEAEAVCLLYGLYKANQELERVYTFGGNIYGVKAAVDEFVSNAKLTLERLFELKKEIPLSSEVKNKYKTIVRQMHPDIASQEAIDPELFTEAVEAKAKGDEVALTGINAMLSQENDRATLLDLQNYYRALVDRQRDLRSLMTPQHSMSIYPNRTAMESRQSITWEDIERQRDQAIVGLQKAADKEGLLRLIREQAKRSKDGFNISAIEELLAEIIE
ncbi:hypothetical protein ACFL52_00175 [Candidatus Margulisiibacteriota bacterium]